MNSCCGYGRKKADDRQPLLPVYNDDTTLQRELHQKLHSYQMWRAMSQGYMPSTEQTIVQLRTLLSADILNPKDTTLSESSRKLLRQTKRGIQQLIDLLQHKAGEDQVQDLIWYLSKSRVSVDTGRIASAIGRAQVKSTTSTAYTSLQTVFTLLFNSSDFRIFLSDLSVTAKQVFADTAKSVSRVADDAAHQLEDGKTVNATDKAAEKGQGPIQENIQQDLSQVVDVVTQGTAEVIKDVEASAEEKLKGDEGQIMRDRLKQTVARLRRRPDYNESVSALSLIIKRVIQSYTRVATDTIAVVEDSVHENAALDRAGKNAWALVTSIGDREAWNEVESSFKQLMSHMNDDPNLEGFLMDVVKTVQSLFTDPNFYDNAGHKLKELQRRAKENEKTQSLSDDVENFLRQCQRTVRSVMDDKDIAALVQTSTNLFNIISPTQPGNSVDILHDGIHIFVPLLISAIQHVPIPRLEVSTPDVDLLLENLILEPGKTINHSSFLPYKLRIETYNDIEIRKAKFKTVSTSSHFVTVKLDGLSIRAEEVGFWLRAHSGLFRLKDQGIISFAMDEKGMDVHIDVEIAKERLENMLTLRDVRVHIHKLDYNMRQSKFSWLSWIIKPLLRPILRKVIEKQLSKAIADFFHAANRELLFARERLRATRISDPDDLLTFLRAVAARLTPEDDPDLYTRIGVDEPGKGVFRGIYAPGSVVKTWHEEAMEAEDRIEDGGETRGWRNEIFDVHVRQMT